MRSVVKRATEMLCGRELPLETPWLFHAPLMQQVQRTILFRSDSESCLCLPVVLLHLPKWITKTHYFSLLGLVLRRCTLDAIGLALWGNPSYIKCVSREYQDLQTLVRRHTSTDHHVYSHKQSQVQ